MKTAEWICTKCGTVNRKLPTGREEVIKDKCLHCKKRHTVEPGDRPVRWKATALK